MSATVLKMKKMVDESMETLAEAQKFATSTEPKDPSTELAPKNAAVVLANQHKTMLTEFLKHDLPKSAKPKPRTFEAMLQQSNMPKWMYTHIERARRGKKKPQLKHVVSSLKRVHQKRQRRKALKPSDVKSLLSSADRMPLQLEQMEARFGPGRSEKPIYELIKGAKEHLSTAKLNLMQTDWVTEIVSFFERRAADVQCLFQQGAKKASSFASPQLEGKSFADSTAVLVKDYEMMMDKVMHALGARIHELMDEAFSEQESGDGSLFHLMQIEDYYDIFFKGMKDMEAIDPAVKCIEPIVTEGMQATKTLTKGMMDSVDEFFTNWIVDVCESTFVYLAEAATNTLKDVIGEETYNALEAQAIVLWDKAQDDTILAMRGLMKVVTKMDEVVNAVKGEELKNEMKDMLKEHMEKNVVRPIVMHCSMNLLVKEIADKIEDMLPHIFDAVADLGGVLGIPVTTFGINIATATGSVATEWVSAVPLAIVQEAYSGIQSAGRGALTAIVQYLTVELVNLAWDTMEHYVIQPLEIHILQPIDDGVTGFIDAVKSKVKEILDLIPPAVMDMLMKWIGAVGKRLLELVAPKIMKEQNLLKQIERLFLRFVGDMSTKENRENKPTNKFSDVYHDMKIVDRSGDPNYVPPVASDNESELELETSESNSCSQGKCGNYYADVYHQNVIVDRSRDPALKPAKLIQANPNPDFKPANGAKQGDMIAALESSTKVQNDIKKMHFNVTDIFDDPQETLADFVRDEDLANEAVNKNDFDGLNKVVKQMSQDVTGHSPFTHHSRK
jgi:hypothetical protein